MTEFACLALAIYFEARDQEFRGQLAVAHVILNRVEADQWPETICGVIQEGAHRRHRCQFSFFCDGLLEEVTHLRAWWTARAVAAIAIVGIPPDPTGGATHYWSVKYSDGPPYWAGELEQIMQIGDHRFYR